MPFSISLKRSGYNFPSQELAVTTIYKLTLSGLGRHLFLLMRDIFCVCIYAHGCCDTVMLSFSDHFIADSAMMKEAEHPIHVPWSYQ